jgi:hypothetical protein
MAVTKGIRGACNMLKQSSTLPAKKKVGANKLVLGFAALAATAVIGTTGVAAAQSIGDTGHGYGGDTSNINLNIGVSGDHNVISVIINFFK